MKQKVFRAFGYVLTRTDLEPGEGVSDEFANHNTFISNGPADTNLTKEEYDPKVFNHIWVITRGKCVTTVRETGQKICRTPGFNTLEHTDTWPLVGVLDTEVLDEMRLFCISPLHNINRVPVVPDVSFFSIKAGEQYEVLNHTRLFFCDGEVLFNGISISETSQLIIASGSITAVKDSYGLIFNG
jgi:hypothetical protein